MNNLFPRSRFSCFYAMEIYKSQHITTSTPQHLNTSPHRRINAVAFLLRLDDDLVAAEHLAWALHLCARRYAVDGGRFGHDEAHCCFGSAVVCRSSYGCFAHAEKRYEAACYDCNALVGACPAKALVGCGLRQQRWAQTDVCSVERDGLLLLSEGERTRLLGLLLLALKIEERQGTK